MVCIILRPFKLLYANVIIRRPLCLPYAWVPPNPCQGIHPRQDYPRWLAGFLVPSHAQPSIQPTKQISPLSSIFIIYTLNRGFDFSYKSSFEITDLLAFECVWQPNNENYKNNYPMNINGSKVVKAIPMIK